VTKRGIGKIYESVIGCEGGQAPEESGMAQRISNRLRITMLIYSMVNAVIFGIGLLIVLLMPPFKTNLGFSIVIVVIISFVLALPIAWLVAPRLQAHYDRKRQLEGIDTSPQ
jgi:ABC-type spermidine/putrescine transport system permease subunit II